MSKHVKTHFDENAPAYSDEARRFIIPCFDDFYGTGIDILAHESAAPRVLDIGAGTGLYAARLLERYPNASLTLIDFSGEMLGLAEKRFAGHEDVRYLCEDYESYAFDATYDIIISALSIHHMDASGKSAFYRKVHSLLAPGGEFLNADLVLAESAELQQRYIEAWFDDLAARGLGESGLTRLRKSVSLDDPSTVADQLSLLRAAGFRNAGCVYRFRNFAVLYGQK
jgi:tRNA (cmo5U34)-methyltransferase